MSKRKLAQELYDALRLYIKLDNNQRAGLVDTEANWTECRQIAQAAIDAFDGLPPKKG